MNNVYKSKKTKMIMNFFLSFVAAAFAYFALLFVRDQFYYFDIKIIYGICVVIVVSYIYLFVFGNNIEVTVTDEELRIKRKGKTKVYRLDEHTFGAKTVNDGGLMSYDLYIYDGNGDYTIVDCELLGGTQFEQMIEDLGVVGDKAPVHKARKEEK